MIQMSMSHRLVLDRVVGHRVIQETIRRCNETLWPGFLGRPPKGADRLWDADADCETSRPGHITSLIDIGMLEDVGICWHVCP